MNRALRKALFISDYDDDSEEGGAELMAAKLDYRWHLREVMAARKSTPLPTWWHPWPSEGYIFPPARSTAWWWNARSASA